MGRNPATGEAIRIKASKKARITASKPFKEAVLAPGNAPKLKKGVWPISNDAAKAAGKASPSVKASAKRTGARRTAKR
jgi:hypothetical protein